MIAAFALLVQATVPSGAYSMPELCAKLTEATGVVHASDNVLRDYPVYIGVKSGDPAKVEKLVAQAFHAEWQKGDKLVRLVKTKVEKDEGFREFERAVKHATLGNRVFSAIPIADLYSATPGDLMRYMEGAISPHFKLMPKEMAQEIEQRPEQVGESKVFYMRRMGYGYYETTPGGPSINFNSLPEDVEALLGSAPIPVKLTEQEVAFYGKLARDPREAKVDFVNVTKSDPIAQVCSPALSAIDRALDKDIVVALPDNVLLPLAPSPNMQGGLQKLLASLSMAVEWGVYEGAVVGKLPYIELKYPAQSKRTSLSTFIDKFQKAGVANIDSLSQYVASQRPECSKCWMDVIMLVFAGVAIDQERIEDYPYNVWLYASFTQADWALLKQDRPFSPAQLSQGAQGRLRELLFGTRQPQTRHNVDPALWPMSLGDGPGLNAKVSEESVLIRDDGGGEVETIAHAAANYSLRKNDLRREPRYQPGMRTKLTLYVTMSLPEYSRQLITGFSNVVPDSKQKPVPWTELPAEIKKQFEEELKKRGEPPPFLR